MSRLGCSLARNLNEEVSIMTFRLRALRAALLSSALAAPVIVWTATPPCSDLATNPACGLAGNPILPDLSSVVTPAAGGNAAYFHVNLTDRTLVGPQYG